MCHSTLFKRIHVLPSLLEIQIDEPNAFGNTALHIACYLGQDAVAIELVNAGANVNQPNDKGFTPLHVAAVSTNGALCLELLVNNGADVNYQVLEGMRLKPVGRGSWFAGVLTIFGLLFWGLDHLPLWVNRPYRDSGECGLRKCHMTSPSLEICPLEERTGHSLCFALKKQNFAMFPQSKEGKSPLHMAAIHGRFTRSQILIQNGMDPDFVLSSPFLRNSSLENPYLLFSPAPSYS